MKNKNFISGSIQAKLAIFTGICLVVVGLVLIIFTTVAARRTAQETSQSKLQVAAQKDAFQIEQKLNDAINISATLAAALKSARSETGTVLTREQVDAMFHQVANEHPELVGLYTAWEQDAFDGKDLDYVNQTGHDATGRFMTYYSPDSTGAMKRDVLYGYETDPYYMCPKNERKTCVSDPAVYKVHGQDILMTSLTVPILINGEFLGIVGIDVSLNALQEMTDSSQIIDWNGTQTILSYDGIIVGMSGHTDLNGTPLSDVQTDAAEDLKIVQSGTETFSPGDNSLEIFVPIHLNGSDKPWSVLGSAPNAFITQEADRLSIQLMALTIALIAMGLIAIWLITGRVIRRPLKHIVRAAETLSNGDLNGLNAQVLHLAETSADELGEMSRSFVRLTNTFIEKIVWYEALLDSIPMPISVTDMDMNWTFINRPVEKFLGIKRGDVLGHQCSEWKAGICKTPDCGVARLRKNQLRTLFDQMGGNFQVDTSYILNSKGEKVGHIEVVQDITRQVSTTRFQTQAVDSMAGALQDMAQGNLGFQLAALPPANENTEEVHQAFEKIFQNLEDARSRLGQALQQVVRNAGEVETAANQLNSASSQAGSATEQIATTIQQVARGVAQQTDSVTQTVTLLVQSKSLYEAVSASTRAQANAIEEVASVAEKITGSQGISAQVSQSAEKVQEMGNRSERIITIVETIKDIASQTNLLALNAAIESARAGEHGKGFAIVADEVRKLAERAAAATKEISQLIVEIQQSVDESIKMTGATSEQLQSESLRLIQVIETVRTSVAQNATVTEQLLASSNEAITAVENIASVSEETSAAAEEVSASTEEMSAQVEEVHASAQGLVDMAENLRLVVGQFQLEQTEQTPVSMGRNTGPAVLPINAPHMKARNGRKY